MKESLWGYWLIVLGIFVITVLLLIQTLTSQNTHDYYAVKEITEASIIDAIDYGYYEDYGEIRIVKEKFVESFLERFSETANLSNTYKVTFYDIYEEFNKENKLDLFIILSRFYTILYYDRRTRSVNRAHKRR